MTDQRPIGFWLKLVDRLIDEGFAATLDEHGVTRRQWQVLNVLATGPSSQQELDAAVAPFLRGAVAAEVADGGESTSAQVEELVESEWVAPSDSGFVLTPLGRQSFERLAEVVGTIRSSVSTGIEDEDYAATTRTLERMARNLGWSGE